MAVLDLVLARCVVLGQLTLICSIVPFVEFEVEEVGSELMWKRKVRYPPVEKDD